MIEWRIINMLPEDLLAVIEYLNFDVHDNWGVLTGMIVEMWMMGEGW
jgi:hypothetical protein